MSNEGVVLMVCILGAFAALMVCILVVFSIMEILDRRRKDGR